MDSTLYYVGACETTKAWETHQTTDITVHRDWWVVICGLIKLDRILTAGHFFPLTRVAEDPFGVTQSREKPGEETEVPDHLQERK